MQEKCYRDLQVHSGIGGIGLLELLALIAVPLILFPLFTLLEINFIYILAIEVALLIIVRMANRISPFAHGLISFVSFHFLWPKKLSAYKLEEQDYIVKKR